MDKTPVEGPVPVLQKDDSFFSKVGIDVTWDRQDVQKFHPHGGNPDGETVKFIVPKQPAGHFMFLGDMWLNMSVTLRDKDGKVLDGATDDVAPADNIGQTMFESVKMFLNETQVSSGNNSASTVAELVSCGMMFSAAARPRRGSAEGTSANRSWLVYAWTVVNIAFSIPKASKRSGAGQRTSVAFRLTEPDQSISGASPTSPGVRQYPFQPSP